jgi:hypothetical protein
VVGSGCNFSGFFTDGMGPPPGACSGPMQRAESLHAALAATPCGVALVSYPPDGDTAAPPQCGVCTPGTTWLEDGVCALGGFCTDNATCADVVDSPFWAQPCPAELGLRTSLGYCGPGLRCFDHVCYECDALDSAPVPGLTCADHRWTPTGWSAVGTDPTATMLAAVTALLLLGVALQLLECLAGCCPHRGCRRAKVAEGPGAEEEEEEEEADEAEAETVVDCDPHTHTHTGPTLCESGVTPPTVQYYA